MASGFSHCTEGSVFAPKRCFLISLIVPPVARSTKLWTINGASNCLTVFSDGSSLDFVLKKACDCFQTCWVCLSAIICKRPWAIVASVTNPSWAFQAPLTTRKPWAVLGFFKSWLPLGFQEAFGKHFDQKRNLKAFITFFKQSNMVSILVLEQYNCKASHGFCWRLLHIRIIGPLEVTAKTKQIMELVGFQKRCAVVRETFSSFP